ncbi:MAG TPA: iron ABC transporter permease [Gammaproteobacteria bacterium]|nr:iron ABC transporter permease [Gammaproteobacteria bacterium]
MFYPSSVDTQAVRPAWRVSDGGWWRLAALLIAVLVSIPVLMLLPAWLTPSSEVWRHLADTVLGELLRNTLVLLLGVGAGVLVLGVGLAWLTVMYEFPGRRIFEWALMLPLGIPAYVMAFVAVGLLDFSGPVQTALRAVFGQNGYWFPRIRSEGGVIGVMILALYPYVYMLARSAFLSQGRTLMEAGRSLGLSPRAAFVRIALPMARPAIAAGVALALMETLADFGAVTIFNYDTFTTAIYKAWFGLFNLGAAAQLSTLLLLFVAVALYAERHWRGQSRYYAAGKPVQGHRHRLTGLRATAACSFALSVLALAFFIPVGQLIFWLVSAGIEDLDAGYVEFVSHTVSLGLLAALITVAAAVLLAYVRKQWPGRLMRAVTRLATLGYALPGAVLAVGIMLAFTRLDRQVDVLVQTVFGVSTGLLLSSSVVALLFAYLVRFLAVAHGPVESALERIKPSLQQAARSLGASHRELLWRVYLPILRPGLLSAALLVFVEVMKELPATLLLRPFDWDTLAIRIFELTSEGEWQRAALPALTLVLVGLLPVIFLVRRSESEV